jgi:hypothetical protein
LPLSLSSALPLPQQRNFTSFNSSHKLRLNVEEDLALHTVFQFGEMSGGGTVRDVTRDVGDEWGTFLAPMDTEKEQPSDVKLLEDFLDNPDEVQLELSWWGVNEWEDQPEVQRSR